MNFSCAEVARAALGEPAARRGAEVLYHCPRHDDRNPSLSLNPAKDCWLCGPCAVSGNAWKLAAFLAGCDPTDKNRVKDWLRERGLLNGGGDGKHVIATYDYTDQDGNLLYQKVRYEPKDFRLRRPNGKGGWSWDLGGVQPTLYNLPAVLQAKSVLFVEGEKDVETARKLGLVATTSGAVGSWRPVFAETFRGKRVVIIADADEPGRKHARQVAADLVGVAESFRLLDLMPYGKDLSEYYFPDSHLRGKDSLLTIIKCARTLTAADVAGWKNDISQLATAGRDDTPPGVLLSEVKPEKVEWLWQNRIPLGKITMLDGDPDLGKSLLTLEIAARLTTGRPLPGETAGISGGVVICTAEDGLEDTVAPRLIAAGADRTRIVALRYAPKAEGEKTVSNIPVDIPTIQAAIERVKAKLVIVDVLFAYLPGQTNTYRDQDVRLALAPLATMAARMGVAVICIRHLTKTPGGNPLYRGGGSIGIIGGARAGLLVAKDPDNPDLIVLAQTKKNLGPPMPSLAYRIEASGDGVPRIVWQGESQQTAVSLLAATAGDEEERGALAEAKEFLREELAGGRRLQKEIKAEARKAGIADATLRRAKTALGVKSGKEGFTAEWYWELPCGSKTAEDAHTQNMSAFAENGGPKTDLTAEESENSTKVLKMLNHQDAQKEMSTFAESEKLLLEESDWEEGTL